MKTIGFIGLGLIGGSIAKAFHKYHPNYRLLAYNRSREALTQAMEEGVIQEVCEAEAAAFSSCDFLFLCTPVEYNIEFLEKIHATLPPHCIITDVGSVKGDIHRKVEALGLDAQFIGGHPMAGSEKTGYDASDALILENAYYIITPGGEVPLDRLTEFTDLITSLGSIPMVITPEEHDFITAGVSHLPHIIAAALVNTVKTLDNEAEYMKAIAAGGFRDITRIASSSPVMWQQICLENQENISQVLDHYIRMLVQIRYLVDQRDSGSLYEFFETSRDYRDSIDVTDNGLLKKQYVLYLDLADEAGGIAQVATILSLDGINIKNIGIIHNREFEQGVLRIEFYEEEAMCRSKALLLRRNYNIYER